MPVKKKTFRRRFKRTFKKRRYGAKRATLMATPNAPIPDRYICKLKYATNTTMITGAGVSAHLFRPASIYDPDFTGVGHQPLGHDQLATLYNQYRVYGMKYKITFHNPNTGNFINVAVVKKKDNSTTTLFSTVEEKPYSQSGIIGPRDGGANRRTFSGYFNNSKQLGVTKQTYNTDDQFTAAMGFNPTASPTLQLYCQEINAVTSLNVYVDVQLEYYCVLFGRTALTQS